MKSSPQLRLVAGWRRHAPEAGRNEIVGNVRRPGYLIEAVLAGSDAAIEQVSRRLERRLGVEDHDLPRVAVVGDHDLRVGAERDVWRDQIEHALRLARVHDIEHRHRGVRVADEISPLERPEDGLRHRIALERPAEVDDDLFVRLSSDIRVGIAAIDEDAGHGRIQDSQPGGAIADPGMSEAPAEEKVAAERSIECAEP